VAGRRLGKNAIMLRAAGAEKSYLRLKGSPLKKDENRRQKDESVLEGIGPRQKREGSWGGGRRMCNRRKDILLSFHSGEKSSPVVLWGGGGVLSRKEIALHWDQKATSMGEN